MHLLQALNKTLFQRFLQFSYGQTIHRLLPQLLTCHQNPQPYQKKPNNSSTASAIPHPTEPNGTAQLSGPLLITFGHRMIDHSIPFLAKNLRLQPMAESGCLLMNLNLQLLYTLCYSNSHISKSNGVFYGLIMLQQ